MASFYDDYYDPGYYNDHSPPSEEIQEQWTEPPDDESEPEPETLPDGPTEPEALPDGPTDEDPPESDQAFEPQCNCSDCMKARMASGEEFTPEQLEEARFGCGIDREKGHTVLAGFGQKSEADEVTELCQCWYPNLTGMTNEAKEEVHRWASMTVPIQGQEIPKEEQEDLETEQLMSDMDAILGKFRKKP
jgi:hypothetical protein